MTICNPSKIYVPYNEARLLIKEGDVLLFRGQGYVSYLIQKAGEGTYSHVALASWHNHIGMEPILEVTEFREGYGGRTTSLSRAYKKDINNGIIDVYRAASSVKKLYFNPRTKTVDVSTVTFNPRAITNYMRNLTGLPYGWSRIWWIATHKLFGFRLFYNISSVSNDCNVLDVDKIYPVCSTAVAACFDSIGYDLIPQRSDEWTEPNDLSRSAFLHYLFTITKSEA